MNNVKTGSSSVQMVIVSSTTGNVTGNTTASTAVTSMMGVKTKPPSRSRFFHNQTSPPETAMSGCSNVPVSSVFHTGGNVMELQTATMPVMRRNVDMTRITVILMMMMMIKNQ